MLPVVVGVSALVLGFLAGYVIRVRVVDQESYNLGYDHGFEQAKLNFFNPQAKG